MTYRRFQETLARALVRAPFILVALSLWASIPVSADALAFNPGASLDASQVCDVRGWYVGVMVGSVRVHDAVRAEYDGATDRELGA